MKIKGLVDYDICNYFKPSMFIIFSKCSFKCDKENGKPICQNSKLAFEPEIEIEISKLFERYNNNPLTKSFVFGGLEPFDTPADLLSLINYIRSNKCNDDIVIYTGYTENELSIGENIKNDAYRCIINNYKNIIIKYGRFIAGYEPHYDENLGINLASPNQYSVKYL